MSNAAGVEYLIDPTRPIGTEFSYVGWAGKHHTLTVDFHLGVAHHRPMREHGIRRALWDIAFGYVSGFPIRAIIYYVLTRSLNGKVEQWVMKREGIEFVDGIAVAKVGQTNRTPVVG